MMKIKIYLIFGALIVCGFSEPVAKKGSLKIDCHAAYRTLTDINPAFESQIISFSSDDVARRSFVSKTATFKTLTMTVRFFAAPEGGLKVTILKSGTTAPISETLYQFSEERGLRNQFDGEHGFTGLNYVPDEKSNAELQHWCEVKE